MFVQLFHFYISISINYHHTNRSTPKLDRQITKVSLLIFWLKMYVSSDSGPALSTTFNIQCIHWLLLRRAPTIWTSNAHMKSKYGRPFMNLNSVWCSLSFLVRFVYGVAELVKYFHSLFQAFYLLWVLGSFSSNNIFQLMIIISYMELHYWNE